jgi:hypothetical protein
LETFIVLLLLKIPVGNFVFGCKFIFSHKTKLPRLVLGENSLTTLFFSLRPFLCYFSFRFFSICANNFILYYRLSLYWNLSWRLLSASHSSFACR